MNNNPRFDTLRYRNDACSSLRSYEQAFFMTFLFLLPVEYGKRCKVRGWRQL